MKAVYHRYKWALWTAALSVVALAVAACTQEIVKEVPVEVTVIVEKEVEKEVVVEVEKIAIATPLPPGEAPWIINLRSPTTKFGGSLTHGTHGPMSHFDLFQAGSIANIGPMGPMYDTLVRVDPLHPVPPVVGDLAHRWEISADGLTYTFFLREGIKFHDGSDMTSEDVVASLNRMIFPDTFQEGLLGNSTRQILDAVSEINAPDDFTVQLILHTGRPFQYVMQGLARGFNIITTKEVLDANKGDLKKVDNYPGTGPYIHVSRDSEKWVQENNAEYWNPNGGFLDRLTHVWAVAYSAAMTANLEGRVVDWVDYVAPKGWKNHLNRGDGGGIKVFSGYISSIAFNHGNPPTDDVRVREAFALVIDQPTLGLMVEEITGLDRTDWFDFGSQGARSSTELDRVPGFRNPTDEDIARAKQLLVEAGYPNCEGMPELSIPTRDLPDRRIFVPAVQAALKQHLGCESSTEIHQTSAMMPVIRSGEWHLVPWTWGTGGVTASASRALNYKCGGVNNNLQYCNPEFDKLADAYIVETDPDKALEIKNQIGATWDDDWPVLPIGDQAVLYAWYSQVKGFPNFNVTIAEKKLHKLDWVWTGR